MSSNTYTLSKPLNEIVLEYFPTADVRIFSQQDVAIQFAWDVAKENTNKQEYVEEQELSEMEIDDGYLLVIKYSPEDDLVTVLKRLVDDPAD